MVILSWSMIDKTHAETPGCDALLELLKAKECQVCPACPQLQACAEGYSCQPDPDSTMRQHYPPAAAETWVRSVVDGELSDVPVDDPRWGSREEGEVYARENADFIVFYWPRGGEATFDSTKLGFQAMWHDFRLATGQSSSGGPIALSAGMGIWFRDSGGGVAIFQRLKNVPSSTDDFLSFYVNPRRDKLPAHRIYPLGQRMMLSAWNPRNINQVNDLHAHGFTAIGPFENAWPSSNTNLLAMIKRAKELGMRAWLFLHIKYVQVYMVCDAWRDGVTDEQIVQKMVSLYSAHYGNPPYDDITDAYVLLPEELSSRLDRCSESRLLALNDKIIDKIRELDKQDPPRPIIRTEVEGTDSSDIQKTAKRIAAPAAQHYFERHGQAGRYKYMAIIQVKTRRYLGHISDLEKNHPIAEVRVPAILAGMIYEPKDTSLEASRKYANYYIWTVAIQGIKSISIYKLDRNVADGNLKRAFMEVMKKFTDLGFDQAFLWGSREPGMPLTITRISGPADASWSQGLAAYQADSMLAADIQYEDKRYIAITNSHWDEEIKVRISGLPTGEYNLRDGKTGKLTKISDSSMKISIEPNGYAIYRVERR